MLYDNYHKSKWMPSKKWIALTGICFTIILLCLPNLIPPPPVEALSGQEFKEMQDQLKKGTWLVA